MEPVRTFSDRHLNKDLARLALPIAFQNLMLAMVAAADAIMLGSIRQDAMSAVSLATQLQFVQNMLLYSVVSAVSVLAAQYWGKQDRKTVDDIFALGLRLCAAVSLVWFIGCEFFPVELMTLFTDEPELIAIGANYLRISAWSYLITGISQCYLCMIKNIGRTMTVAVISTATVLLNILLNAVLIYGWFGIPPMEERGAATATTLSRVFELVSCLAVSYLPKYIHPSARALVRRPGFLARDFYRSLLPLGGGAMLWTIGFTAYSAFMGHLGKDAAAANSVAAVVRDLVCCLCNGLGTGAGVLLGYALGRGDLKNGKLMGIRICKMSFWCGGVSAVLMLALTPGLMAVVDLTGEARQHLLLFMLVLSFYMIGRAVNTIVINGIFAAGGDTVFDPLSLAVTMWGMAIPLAVLGTFVFKWPPVAVYAMTCLDEVGKIPWVILHFRKYKWVRDLTRETDPQSGTV